MLWSWDANMLKRFQVPECSTTSRSHFTKHRTSSLQISSSMRIKPYLLPLWLAVFFDTYSLNLPTQGMSLYIEQIQVKIHPQTFETWMISDKVRLLSWSHCPHWYIYSHIYNLHIYSQIYNFPSMVIIRLWKLTFHEKSIYLVPKAYWVLNDKLFENTWQGKAAEGRKIQKILIFLRLEKM